MPTLETIKKVVTSTVYTTVLHYYNLKKEVTLQCDASHPGFGATLMQNGQPLAYAPPALTPVPRLKNELLAIVFASDHFEAYVYGKVETDHEPLLFICLKVLIRPSACSRGCCLGFKSTADTPICQQSIYLILHSCNSIN